MITTTTNYKNAISDMSRLITVKAYFNGSATPLSTDYIQSCTITEMSSSEDNISIGDFCSNSCQMTVFMETPIQLKNGKVRITGQVNDLEEIPLGTFYITEINKDQYSNIVSFVGYNTPSNINNAYVSMIDLPTSADSIVKDICSQLGVSYEASSNFGSAIIETLYEGSYAQQIKWLSALEGKNARINRYGKLEFYWYQDANYTIDGSQQYQSGFVKTTEEDITINSLTSGTEENTITVGSGYGITFDNPYMTQEILNSIFENINGFTYTPCTLKWRGDYAVEVCDILKVIDINDTVSNVIISENVLVATGLNSTITCNGLSEEEFHMSVSPTENKINKAINFLQSSFKESTETILGHNGGYFSIDYNSDGLPSGWTLMDTPTLTDKTNLWKFTSGGLGHSSDGGKTFSEIAIDMFGRINAKYITTGNLSGECFELDLNEGTMTIGKRDENGNFEDILFKATTSNTTIGGWEIGTNGLYSTGDITNQTFLYDDGTIRLDQETTVLNYDTKETTVHNTTSWIRPNGISMRYDENNGGNIGCDESNLSIRGINGLFLESNKGDVTVATNRTKDNIVFLIATANEESEVLTPYYKKGDEIPVHIYTSGFVSSSGTKVYFSVPLSKPIIGTPTIKASSNRGFILRQSGKYTHGTGNGTYNMPSSYAIDGYDDSSIRVVATFTTTTNAINNDAIGINWDGFIKLS